MKRGVTITAGEAVGGVGGTGGGAEHGCAMANPSTPMLIGSTVLGDRFEPLLNVGIDCDAERAERSAVRWALGSTAWVAGPLTAALVFLGRHELAAPADRIPAPFFFQIQRSDVVDASVGFRWRFSDAWNVALNALVPLGRDGLRAEVVPTLQVDYGFKLPR